MTFLTSARKRAAFMGEVRNHPLAAGAKVWGGALLMRNAAGYIVAGSVLTVSVLAGGCGVGCAEASADNTGGAAVALRGDSKIGHFLFANSAAADLIDQAQVGKICYMVDDQTVAKTDASGARSRAGIVDSLEGSRIWVRFDGALTRAS